MVSRRTSCSAENQTVVRSCYTEPCSCPHVATEWNEWSECSASCGGGTQRRSRDLILGTRGSCFKHADFQTKTCNMDSCPALPDKCSWWDFLGGEVFEGVQTDSTIEHCYDDINFVAYLSMDGVSREKKFVMRRSAASHSEVRGEGQTRSVTGKIGKCDRPLLQGTPSPLLPASLGLFSPLLQPFVLPL